MIQQAHDGKWWSDLSGNDFDPSLIGNSRDGQWFYDGCLSDTISGPYDSEAEAQEAIDLMQIDD